MFPGSDEESPADVTLIYPVMGSWRLNCCLEFPPKKKKSAEGGAVANRHAGPDKSPEGANYIIHIHTHRLRACHGRRKILIKHSPCAALNPPASSQ